MTTDYKMDYEELLSTIKAEIARYASEGITIDEHTPYDILDEQIDDYIQEKGYDDMYYVITHDEFKEKYEEELSNMWKQYE